MLTKILINVSIVFFFVGCTSVPVKSPRTEGKQEIEESYKTEPLTPKEAVEMKKFTVYIADTDGFSEAGGIGPVLRSSGVIVSKHSVVTWRETVEKSDEKPLYIWTEKGALKIINKETRGKTAMLTVDGSLMPPRRIASLDSFQIPMPVYVSTGVLTLEKGQVKKEGDTLQVKIKEVYTSLLRSPLWPKSRSPLHGAGVFNKNRQLIGLLGAELKREEHGKKQTRTYQFLPLPSTD